MNEIKIKYSKDALKFLSKLDKKSVTCRKTRWDSNIKGKKKRMYFSLRIN